MKCKGKSSHLDLSVDAGEIGGLPSDGSAILLLYAMPPADDCCLNALRFGHSDLLSGVTKHLQILLVQTYTEQRT